MSWAQITKGKATVSTPSPKQNIAFNNMETPDDIFTHKYGRDIALIEEKLKDYADYNGLDILTELSPLAFMDFAKHKSSEYSRYVYQHRKKVDRISSHQQQLNSQIYQHIIKKVTKQAGDDDSAEDD